MLIELEFDSDEPIYEQLKAKIIIGIAKGQLLPGERLPSVRSFASDLGINLHTVNKAYQQLKAEGFLQIHRQRGVTVNPDGPSIMTELEKIQFKKSLIPLLATSLCKGMTPEEITVMIQKILKEDLGVDRHD